MAWQTELGQGYAAPSVMAGRVYLNDYSEAEQEWMVRCLALDDGQELWRYKVKKRIRPNHAITRSAPATDGGFVFAIDPKCELHCLDARDGICRLEETAARRVREPDSRLVQRPVSTHRWRPRRDRHRWSRIDDRSGKRYRQSDLGDEQYRAIPAIPFFDHAGRDRGREAICLYHAERSRGSRRGRGRTAVAFPVEVQYSRGHDSVAPGRWQVLSNFRLSRTDRRLSGEARRR